jgi:L-ribulokinase
VTIVSQGFLIGLDFGTASARGVLVDAQTGAQVESTVHRYRHGVLSNALPTGRAIQPGYALQVPADYLEAAEDILRSLGQGRVILSIGVAFTASSPLPTLADGMPLQQLLPDEPHAYVKLWKHSGAQPYADEINEVGGSFLDNFGGRVSGEAMLPKAIELARESPATWSRSARFIEAGDWLVWQLSGTECRSMDLACFKAQYTVERGYPSHLLPGLIERLGLPAPVGTAAGALTGDWRRRTGLHGRPTVAVASIDAHAVMPAVRAVRGGSFVGALGTSAGYIAVHPATHALPTGLEGAAMGAALPDLWCCEAGQAAFGDMLTWFAETFPLDADAESNFAKYDVEAAAVKPGQTGLVILDWFGGNRIPWRDLSLGGVLAGLRVGASAGEIYRAMVESLCFGARLVLELVEEGGIPVSEIIFTSGLARNAFLVQTMTDVLGRNVSVPQIEHSTAVGAAIHGAVSAHVVSNYYDGALKYGAKNKQVFEPTLSHRHIYNEMHSIYRELVSDNIVRSVMHRLFRLNSRRQHD